MRDDAAWLWDIAASCRRIGTFIAGLDREKFLASELHTFAVMQQLTVIGEAAKNVSAELRAAHSEIEWTGMARFRDLAVHHYWRINPVEVWEIAVAAIPETLIRVEPLIPPIDEWNP